jgi:hypothetical protein
MNGLTEIPTVPNLLSSETTAKGTGLAQLAGKEDPVELDSRHRSEVILKV